MDWHGIEWAIPIYEMAMLVLPIYVFVLFYRRVKRGVLKKSRALSRYASIVIAPIILYAMFFFVLAEFEELTRISIITEGLSRTFFILIGLGTAIWLISILVFGVALAFVKRQPSLPNKSVR